MNAQVLKYAKTVYQLEKGLPPNGVVPKLKVKVEDMKDKVRYASCRFTCAYIVVLLFHTWADYVSCMINCTTRRDVKYKLGLMLVILLYSWKFGGEVNDNMPLQPI